MTSLLTDDALVAKLAKQTGRAPERTWEQYAAELWGAFQSETT
jgi:hypothetical protein